MLKADHDRVRSLPDQMEHTTERGSSTREKLLATIEQELAVHAKIEEDVFYPTFFDGPEEGRQGARCCVSAVS